MGQLLPIATILLQNAVVITKYDAYYKLRQYNCIVGYFVYDCLDSCAVVTKVTF